MSSGKEERRLGIESNLILIGMPGSGKSTLGRYLAESLQLKFIDTDELIEKHCGYTLQRLLDRHGHRFLQRVESEVICEIATNGHVIATGGSAVYSEDAMLHLSSLGTVVYLEISLAAVIRRVAKAPDRGIAKSPNTSLASLYRERLPLYQRWANLTLKNDRPLTALRLEQILKLVNSANLSDTMQPNL